VQLFGVHGGKIGRALDNDWVLPDPDRYVSSHHAKVVFRAGSWLLEDLSTNGVFVNDNDVPLSATGPRKLKDGDRLRFGDYDVVVSIKDDGDFPAHAGGQMPSPASSREQPKTIRSAADQADYLRRGTFRNHQDNRSSVHEIHDLGAELDITGLLVASSRESRDEKDDALTAFDRGAHEEAPAATNYNNGSSAKKSNSASPASTNTKAGTATASLLDDFLHEDITRAATASEPPEDWHMSTRRLQRRNGGANPAPVLQVVPATPKQREIAAPILRAELPARGEAPKSESTRRAMDGNLDSHSGIEALCRGAGIDPTSIPGDAHAALLSLAGQMIREVVLDLMEALRNRGDIKSRLSLLQTGIQPNQNNPLKLSTSVEDAIRKLLDGNSTRNLGAVEALREAFTDLKNHQTAIDTGMNAALNDLLGRVDPAELQERFDRGLKRNAPQATINKAKYWELYAEFYPLLNQRDTRGWPAVFTEEFTRAYAAKVDELENTRKR
jgi:type VI secretion system FHA domain protein